MLKKDRMKEPERLGELEFFSNLTLYCLPHKIIVQNKLIISELYVKHLEDNL